MRQFRGWILLGILVCVAMAILVVAIRWFLGSGFLGVWQYNYRDEGGHAVFVTREFDFVTRGRQWKHDDDFYVAGGSILFVRDVPWIKPSTSEWAVKQHGNEVRLNVGGLQASILQGKTLVIGDQRIALDEFPRHRVVVYEDGSIDVGEAPVSEHPWYSIEYIRALSKQQASEVSQVAK